MDGFNGIKKNIAYKNICPTFLKMDFGLISTQNPVRDITLARAHSWYNKKTAGGS